MTPTLEEQKKECLIRMKLSGLKLHNPHHQPKKFGWWFFCLYVFSAKALLY